MRKFPFSAQDFAAISTLGLEFAVAVALGAAAGIWADRAYHTLPWFSLVGIVTGFALGMYIVIKEAKRLEQANALKDKK